MSTPERSAFSNLALLAANYVAAIATITLNKRALAHFPFPATLTSMHYFVCWAGVALLRAAGQIEARPVPPGQGRVFCALVMTWSACNALSNVSLQKNSVGFYQLAKLMVTPCLVAIDRLVYGRHATPLQALALLLSCVGVGLASVGDVQLHAYGATVASLAVATAATQKVLNSHLQQFGGLSALQVMHNAFPVMCLLSVLYVPLMDGGLADLVALEWLSLPALATVLVSGIAAFAATWSATAIFGLISALAHVLLGQVKTCSVLLIGALFYAATPTPQGVGGASLALAAITAYSLLKVWGSPVAAARTAGARLLPAEESDEDRRPLTRR